MKGEIEAVSSKEIETKRGQAIKTAYMLNGEWYNTWGKPEFTKGDWVEINYQTNDFGKQIKEIKKTTPVLGQDFVKHIKGNYRTPEVITRDRALELALKVFELNKVKNFGESEVLVTAKIFEDFMNSGAVTENPAEEVVE